MSIVQPVLQLLVQLEEVSVPPVDCELILGHLVEAYAGVHAVGDEAEQPPPDLDNEDSIYISSLLQTF